MSDILLKLNVSGTPLFVRKSTVESCGIRSLSALCNFEGRYIDRPLDAFKFVLDWVKTMGEIELPTSIHDLSRLQYEAKYWQVDDLTAALRQRMRNIEELTGVSPPFNLSNVEDRDRASQWMRERIGMLTTQVQHLGDNEVVIVSTCKL